jgi:hypothetical protein
LALSRTHACEIVASLQIPETLNSATGEVFFFWQPRRSWGRKYIQPYRSRSRERTERPEKNLRAGVHRSTQVCSIGSPPLARTHGHGMIVHDSSFLHPYGDPGGQWAVATLVAHTQSSFQATGMQYGRHARRLGRPRWHATAAAGCLFSSTWLLRSGLPRPGVGRLNRLFTRGPRS